MRIPLSFGELSVIRSGARLLIPVAGVGLILATLYAGAIWMERLLSKKEEIVQSIPSSARSIPTEEKVNLSEKKYRFPYRTVLESNDGRRLEAVLLGRPSEDEVIFQRTSDDRVFALGLDRLSADSRSLLSAFPSSGSSSQKTDLFRMIYPDKPLIEGELGFPHTCTLVNTEGKMLAVTLLSRPSPGEVTFRRQIDQKVFTIPLTRLIESDRKFIRLFDAEIPGNSPDRGLR